jgi:CubicO group peptidase (beta-lactamase class C family)
MIIQTSRSACRFLHGIMLMAIVLGMPTLGPGAFAQTSAHDTGMSPNASTGADSLSGRLASIDKIVSQARDEGIFRGNLLIAERDRTIFDQSYGAAVIEWRRPLSSGVIFRLGSITKLFTSMVILKLAEDRQLQLDSTISDHLSYYRKDTGTKITIAELLDHSSGLPDYTTDPNFASVISRLKIPTKEFIVKYGERDLLFPPGTGYYYSNTGYFILGAIIESVTGRPYGDNLAAVVFKPLGMESSGYGQNALVLPDSAEGYLMEGCRESVAPFAELSIPFAAGAAYSTVRDLQRFYQGIRANTVLTNQYTELMLQPHIVEPQQFEGGPIYSTYGWDRFEMQVPDNPSGNKVVVHSKSGEINGFVNLVLMTEKYFVAVLSNSQDAYTGTIGLATLSILYGVPAASVVPQKSVSTLMREAICGPGPAPAALYEQQRAKGPPQSFSEATLSTLGQNFLGVGLNIDVTLEDIDRALMLFQLNAKYYPQQPGVYTDLASGYAMKASHLPAALRAGGAD